MIFYKAVCKIHGWQSPGLYARRADAVRSARAHRSNMAAPHEIIIQQVYIPSNLMAIQSESVL